MSMDSDLFGNAAPAEEPPLLEEDAQEIDETIGHTPDRFGGVNILPPYANTSLLGHEDTEKHLMEQWQNQRLPHAIALSGPRGIGKATLAFQLARFVLHDSVEEQDALFGASDAPLDKFTVPEDSTTYRQCISGGHPDLLALGHFFGEEEVRKEIYAPKIDDIRKIPAFLRMTSGYGGWRVVIVDNADTMNNSAQNAILKILEEPPKKTLLILVVHRFGALLPTIKSRIQVQQMNDMKTSDIKELLRQEDPAIEHDDLDILSFIAEGSAGRALSLLREGGASDALDTLSQIVRITELTELEVDETCIAMSGLGKKDQIGKWREILLWTLRSIIKGKSRGVEPFEALDLQGNLSLKISLQQFVEKASVQSWLNILEQLQDHFQQCSAQHLDAYHQVYGALKIVRQGCTNE